MLGKGSWLVGLDISACCIFGFCTAVVGSRVFGVVRARGEEEACLAVGCAEGRRALFSVGAEDSAVCRWLIVIDVKEASMKER